MVIQQCEQTSQYVNKQHVTNETAFFVRNGGQLRKKRKLPNFNGFSKNPKIAQNAECTSCLSLMLFSKAKSFQNALPFIVKDHQANF